MEAIYRLVIPGISARKIVSISLFEFADRRQDLPDLGVLSFKNMLLGFGWGSSGPDLRARSGNLLLSLLFLFRC